MGGVGEFVLILCRGVYGGCRWIYTDLVKGVWLQGYGVECGYGGICICIVMRVR